MLNKKLLDAKKSVESFQNLDASDRTKIVTGIPHGAAARFYVRFTSDDDLSKLLDEWLKNDDDYSRGRLKAVFLRLKKKGRIHSALSDPRFSDFIA